MELTTEVLHQANKIKAKYTFNGGVLPKDDVIFMVNTGSFFKQYGNKSILLNEYMLIEMTNCFNKCIVEQKKLMEEELIALGKNGAKTDLPDIKELLEKEIWEEEDDFSEKALSGIGTGKDTKQMSDKNKIKNPKIKKDD